MTRKISAGARTVGREDHTVRLEEISPHVADSNNVLSKGHALHRIRGFFRDRGERFLV